MFTRDPHVHTLTLTLTAHPYIHTLTPTPTHSILTPFQLYPSIPSHNSHFHNNQGRRGSADTTSVSIYRVLITFKGSNSFVNNNGGGITLLGSRMDVNGSVVFDGNRAVFGGGVAMAGRSLVSGISITKIIRIEMT